MRFFDRIRREENEEVLAFVKPEPEPEPEPEIVKQYPYFEVDFHADAVYVTITDLNDKEIALTKTIAPSINADYDADGNVVGIEFLTMLIDFGEQFKLRRRDEL